MERTAELSQSVGAWALVMTCAMYGCTRDPLPGEGEDEDPQPLADVPADLPDEPMEFEGVLQGVGYPNEPTRFWECETEEVFEMSYVGQQGELWSGSCWGVYNRVRGRLDRSFDPPRLIIEETLEARWSVPSDCAFFLEPDYISCHFEDENANFICEPASILCDGVHKCSPVRFFASESAGWKHHECLGSLGDGVAGDPCEYPEAGGGEKDTCAQGNRCWNPTGDLTAPGICVPYCDLTGEFGPTCEGTCVRCSSSDQDGLCMTDCSGDECNVDAFC